MLLLLLLHLVIIHLLTARDAPPRKGKDTEYVIRHIDTCPDVGYYFRRDTSPNALEPGPCYLCFCQGDSTAVCWKRDNRRCNVESFHYHGVGKRDTRIRRSPGFADLFFRDATRDLFDKNTKSECKPFESSFSDDCPPADWCTGCTVCDCDANGRWDCHVLSFCPDKKSKKKSKHKGPVRKVVAKKPVKSTKPPTRITRTTRRPPAASSAGKHPHKHTKAINKSKPKHNPMKSNNNNKNVPQKRIVKKSVPVLRGNVTPRTQKFKTPIRYRRISPPKADAKKELIIKKDVATHKPIDIKSSKVNLEMEIAQTVMKKVMANLRKSIKGEMVNVTKLANDVAKKSGKPKNVKKAKPKPKSKPSKKMNKRQVKKPQKKPLRTRYQLKPSKQKYKPQKKVQAKPPKRPYKKPSKKPIKKPPPKNYVRNKRDLLEADLKSLAVIGQGNFTGPPSTTVSYSVIPVTSYILAPAENNCSQKFVETTTVPENDKYYSYVVHVEDPKMDTNRSTTVEFSPQVNVTETILNLIGKDILPNKTIKKNAESSNYGENKSSALSELHPEANDLKFSKWTHLKILKEKKMNHVSEKHRGLMKLISPANKTVVEDYKNKVHGKDIERKYNSRKFNLVKLLNHSKYKPTNIILAENHTIIMKPNKTAGDLQILLSKLLGEFYKNTTLNSNTSKKARKFSVIKYLKRIFNKLFRRKKSAERFSRHHIIETLCDNFGPCKVSIKDKAHLKTKLNELDSETSKILRTVKIIKGLLKLVDLPKSADSDASTHESMHTDIQKLNDILKGNYPNEDSNPMTSTQLTQIKYIKKNTQDFVQSVNKFASLLNEIIAILTKHAGHKADKRNRTVRYNHTDSKMLKDENPFQSLKHLFIRYNLVQNSFMKRMYEQLNNFENKVNENSKVSEVKDLNNTVEIENFSRNIIQNLRKLKRLAQTLSFSGRTKRDTMKDDDAIEYLLMLMEYLLKQNHPLDAAPVNDGIDLLIEAIKNAPDIKPIKKKVLEYTPAPYGDLTTISYPIAMSTDSPLSDDESHSDNVDNDRTSSEDSGRHKLEDTEDTLKTKIEENKEFAEMVAEEDKEPDDKYQYNRKTVLDKAEEYTETPFYNRAYENVIPDADNAIETTTTLPMDFEMNGKIYKDDGLDNVNMDTQANLENNNINIEKQIIDSERVEEKKFEVFTGDMDEEAILPATMLTSVSDHPSTMTIEYATQPKKAVSKTRRINLESVDSESIDKKSKLEWIEENFGRERDKETDFTDPDDFNITTPVTVAFRTLSTATTDKADLSVLTKEVVDDAEKKRKAKMNAEDVMFRKQMDLLNSLDYGTEKAEFDESESKDGNVEERYSSDTFQSYFR